MLVAGLGDLIGALVRPFGPYFIGFTITNALSGLIYGLLLYKNPNKKMSNLNFIIRIIISNLIVIAIVNILLDTVSLMIMYNKAFMYFLSIRIAAKAILLPVNIIVIFVLERTLRPFIEKDLYEEEESIV